MNVRHNALIIALVATVSMATTLPAYADRGKSDGRHDDRQSQSRSYDDAGKHAKRNQERRWQGSGRRQNAQHSKGHYNANTYNSYAKEGYHNGSYYSGRRHHSRGYGNRHSVSPPRYGHYRGYYRPPAYRYAPLPRYRYIAPAYDVYVPAYSSGLSLWLDGVGFSYYESGY